MSDAADSAAALAVLLLMLWSIAVYGRAECRSPKYWQSRPGVCQRRSREIAGTGPRGGYVDLSPDEPSVGVPIKCTGGTTLHRDGSSVWCQR